MVDTKEKKEVLLAGLLERFDGVHWSRPGGGEPDAGERMRISVFDGRGGLVKEVTLTGEPGEEGGVRMPLGARRCEVVYERPVGEGRWEECGREAVAVKALDRGHARRFGGRIVRLIRGGIVKGGWTVLRGGSFVFRRTSETHPGFVRKCLSRTWRRFEEAARERGPREAWAQEKSRFARFLIWGYACVGEERLGVLHQKNEALPPVFDELPPLETGTARLPKLVVVTPSYNQGHFLGATMDSVLAAEGVDLDYLVMDGGSRDSSVEVIREREARLKHWQSERDGGQSAAIRAGFDRTQGDPDDIMAYLNSDDLFCPGAVEFVLRWFALHPEVDAVYGHRIIVDEEGREVGRWTLPPHDPEVLSMVDLVPQETLFWRRRIHDAVGGFDPSFQFAMDWDFLLRLKNAGARIERLPWYLGCFRIHSDQKTHATMETVGAKEIDLLRRRENRGRALAPEVLRESVIRSQVESAWYQARRDEGERV